MREIAFSWPTLLITHDGRRDGSAIWIYSSYWTNWVETHYYMENRRHSCK